MIQKIGLLKQVAILQNMTSLKNYYNGPTQNFVLHKEEEQTLLLLNVIL